VVYSGRNEALIGPLLEIFESQTGLRAEVRYGSTTEMAATLLEEGRRTPADVFLSQDAASLGAISAAGLFEVLEIVYNTERIQPHELPQRLEEIGSNRYRSRFGVAPTNGSFQAHMAVFRAVNGPQALDELLRSIARNDPRRYPKNSAIVEAVLSGEVDFGLVNHYYLWRALREDPTAPGANFFPPGGGASGFVNVAGAGVLSERPEAEAFVAFLLSERAQRYFAEETYEYPLVAEVEPSVDLPALAEVSTPEVDFGDVSAVFEETLSAIAASGLVQ
jgi:iron(III) transport system substrate-binding protein